MAKLTKITEQKLEAALTRRLTLEEPLFLLERAGGRLIGNIISPSFRGKRDSERQQMIWDALDAEFGNHWGAQVGMLLAYTPQEWTLGSETAPSKKTRKAG